MGEFEGTTKRLNPQIMTIKEGYHSKGIQNIFSKIREDYFPNLKKITCLCTRGLQNTSET